LAGRYALYGIISAAIGLFILPEVFCSIAVVLGAYAWKKEEVGSRGLVVVIAGLACMLIGIYVTAFIG
jgi:membrane-bound ClpP family serine protease